MSAASRYYSGPYNYGEGGNIYVHFHSENIGRAMNESAVSSLEIIEIFKKRKMQAFQASKNQFRNLFKQSLDNKSAELLNQVFNNDDLMTKLQKEMGEKFEEALAVDKMQKLMDIQRTVVSNNFAKDLLSKSKKSIEAFNTLLAGLASAARLLNTKSGSNLAALLSHQYKSTNNIQSFGKFLLKALKTFEKQNKKILLSELEIQQAEQVVQNIKSLANALETGKTSKGKDLSQKTINKLAEDIFNTGFAESISAILKNTAYVSLDQNFKATLTGKEAITIQYSDQFGKAIEDNSSQKSFGKADAMFENVKIKIDEKDKHITLDIGISDKFYKLNNFPGLKGSNNKNLYSSGSGGSLVEALWSSFGTNLKYLYYAYNVLGHGNKNNWNQAQMALNEVILTRQIVRLFSSRGGKKDFAQFMFVNGQIISVWDIIMSTLQDVSYSKSFEGVKTQPVTLTIQGRGEIQSAAQTYKETVTERIYDVNRAVQRAKIKAELNLNNL